MEANPTAAQPLPAREYVITAEQPALAITVAELEEWRRTLVADPYYEIAGNALAGNSIDDITQSRQVSTSDASRHLFSNQIDHWEASDQRATGRCWIFASLNVLRAELVKNMKSKNIALSANYLYFYDKLERSNLFLLHMIEMSDVPLGDRALTFLFTSLVGDGGQWALFVNLVKKYGVCPREAFPETYSSDNSIPMLKLLRWKLKEGAKDIRNAYKAGDSQSQQRQHGIRKACLAEIYKILTLHLGTPPKRFDFSYIAKGTAAPTKMTDISPLDFYDRYIKLPLDNYVCLIHDPRPTSPLFRKYTVALMGNVAGGSLVEYFNVDSETMKSATMKSVVDGKVVMIGSEFARFVDRSQGLFDADLYQYAKFFRTTFNLNKSERLQYHYGAATHAMAITGVDVVDGKPVKWRVENSHGEKSGKKGFYVMADNWFDEWLYEVVVQKIYLPEKFLRSLDTPPTILPPWDPIGALAGDCGICQSGSKPELHQSRL